MNDYTSKLDLLETEIAIKYIKDNFERLLSTKLFLTRVSAPLFVLPETGLNDNLNGFERAVSFDILDLGKTAEIVQSLAKWKRMALAKYHFKSDTGLYTDMNAIRRDEKLDNLHSIYVDQWDWEKIIDRSERNLEYLKQTVSTIYQAILALNSLINEKYPELTTPLPSDIFFISTAELESLYPNLSRKERENAITKEHKAVFILGIGDELKSGEKHDGRSPDYDDWKLNGDILFYDPLLNSAIELSSMGIRVDKAALEYQLQKSGCEDRRNLPFHKALLEEKLPLTMGGGIGQSRICMFFLRKAHIGEVQASIWDEYTHKQCEAANIELL